MNINWNITHIQAFLALFLFPVKSESSSIRNLIKFLVSSSIPVRKNFIMLMCCILTPAGINYKYTV